MTVDREQIRRDAELMLKAWDGHQVIPMVRNCLALLAELEQADALIEAARSLHAGLTCQQDPMDVDQRIERLGAALSDFEGETA